MTGFLRFLQIALCNILLGDEQFFEENKEFLKKYDCLKKQIVYFLDRKFVTLLLVYSL